MQLMSWKSNSD